MKFNYKKGFAEYQETKLTTKYKISESYFVELKRRSNNVNTYKNAPINLEYFIVYLAAEYHLKDIFKFYMSKFKSKYKKKIWYMNPHFKGSDFFCLVGEFKSNFSSMHKQVNNFKMGKKRVVFQEQTGYFEGAIFRKK